MMAVVAPQQLQPTRALSTKDMNLTGDDLMPSALGADWPKPAQMQQAQQRAGIITDAQRTDLGVPLFVDVADRVVLPPGDKVTMEVLAVCHQGDWTHRSMKETIAEFKRHFKLQGLGVKAEAEYIRALCRKCLSCIKTRTGSTVPRPLWYMVYATRPYEYLHLDFIELPDPSNGKKYVLVITDDFSLKTVLHATEKNDAATVAKVLLEQWLSNYPDPELIHSDGGSHFDNQVVKLIAKARGWKHTICTPYAKWANGVAERSNKTMVNILTTLCRNLSVEVNKWTSIIKTVQGAMNRQRRASRGNMSPIELTTGIVPMTAASIMYHDGAILEVLDKDATLTVREYARKMAHHMEKLYDMANIARRATSDDNRKRTCDQVIPRIDVGDFVLYAKHKKDTKLDYTWLGPAVVTGIVSPLVITIRPYTAYESETFDVHMSRIRRFAGKNLRVTETLQHDIDKDHPDNIIAKVVKHTVKDGTLYVQCRWKGFTAEMDSMQEAGIIYDSVPSVLTDYYKRDNTVKDAALRTFMEEKFPTLTEENRIARQRRVPGAVVPGRRPTLRRHGTNLNTATTRQQNDANNNKMHSSSKAQPTTTMRRRNQRSNNHSAQKTLTTAERYARRCNERTQREQHRTYDEAAREKDRQMLRAILATHREMFAVLGSPLQMWAVRQFGHVMQTRMWAEFTSPTRSQYGGRRCIIDKNDIDECSTRDNADNNDNIKQNNNNNKQNNNSNACGAEDGPLPSSTTKSPPHTGKSNPNMTNRNTLTTDTTVLEREDPDVHDETCNHTDNIINNGNLADSEEDDTMSSSDTDTEVNNDLAADKHEQRSAAMTASNADNEKPDESDTTNVSGRIALTPSTAKQKRQSMYCLKTEVRPSSIPGAGLGLWLLEKAKKKDRVAIYSGEVLDALQASKRHSHYMMEINKNTFVDAEHDFSHKGRYLNDGGRSGRKNNCRMSKKRSLSTCSKTGKKWASIVASETIIPPAELFMPYGRKFKWPNKDKQAKPMHMTTPTPKFNLGSTSPEFCRICCDENGNNHSDESNCKMDATHTGRCNVNDHSNDNQNGAENTKNKARTNSDNTKSENARISSDRIGGGRIGGGKIGGGKIGGGKIGGGDTTNITNNNESNTDNSSNKKSNKDSTKGEMADSAKINDNSMTNAARVLAHLLLSVWQWFQSKNATH